MKIWPSRFEAFGSLELSDGLISLVQTIKRFPHENVGGSGTRVLAQNLPKFHLCTGIVLRSQAALCQNLPKLEIGWLCLRQWLQDALCFGEAFCPVIAHPKEHAGLAAS